MIFAMLAGLIPKFILPAIQSHFQAKRDLATAQEQTKRETQLAVINAEVERRNAQRDVLLAGNRWLQILFVVPLGIWFSAVILDSIFLFSWSIAALPHPLDEWSGLIISALFLVDAGPRFVAAFKK